MSSLPLDKDCFVTSITLAAVSRLGQEALDADPLILRDLVCSEFGMDSMPQRMFDKLNCGMTLLGTSLFTSAIEGFLTGVACMCNQSLDASTIPFCSLRQCAWGIWEYINLNGDIDADGKPTETFCPEIRKYLQEAGKLNGVTQFPSWMEFATPPPLPDMTSDVDLFEQYNARQRNYIERLNAYVTQRSDAMTEELKKLQKAGIIGPREA